MPLELKTLQSLLVEKSMGALPPDVDALLEAYLETDQAAASEATALRQTVSLIRRALPGGVAMESLPEPQFLKIARFPAPEPLSELDKEDAEWEASASAGRFEKNGRGEFVRRFVVIAAVFVGGILLGLTVPRWFSSEPISYATARPVFSAPSADQIPGANASASLDTEAAPVFWSRKELRLSLAHSSSREATRAVWKSPIQRPAIQQN